MNNLKESITYKKPEVFNSWDILKLFSNVFANSQYEIAGIDFVTRHEDIYKITSVSNDNLCSTKSTTKLDFPFAFNQLIVIHLDKDGFGAVAKTIFLVKTINGPIEMYKSSRRGRFNKFILDKRHQKGLRLKLQRLKEEK